MIKFYQYIEAQESQWFAIRHTFPIEDNPLPQLDMKLKIDKVNSQPDYFTMKNMISKEVYLPINQLVSTQSWIRPVSIKYFTHRKTSMPKVDKWHGIYVITDGNHRILAAKLNGESSIKVNLRDFDSI